ncbi:MAG: response regulator [Acetobacteraceae bacterium]|nr:response regulator [Acetobacteraceae bacterium]
MDRETEAVIAIVDDDDDVGEVLRGLLEIVGYQVVTYKSGQAFLDDAQLADVACLVVDQNMPEMTGLELLKRLKAMGNATPSLLITGDRDDEVTRQALALGVMKVLEKPMATSELLSFISFSVG